MTSPDQKQAFLVADDEQANRTLFEIMLKRSFPQAALFFAENGLEAWQQIPQLVEKHPDLVVLSDVQMGGLEADGPRFLKNIRKSENPEIARLRVLMHSTYAGSESQVRKMIDEQAGEQFKYEFLKKPIAILVLEATIFRMLSE
jgi:CheY-like chemotaxis protein